MVITFSVHKENNDLCQAEAEVEEKSLMNEIIWETYI